MADSGLLFIPDISGYTRFVNQTEVEHSRHIVTELLETLINSNQLQLQVSEIEGDAILFYRFGEIPSLEEIYNQVRVMFCNFHNSLKYFASRRICQCSACRQADMLTLKVITHEGLFSTYNIKEFNQLIGSDVITVHQLMKNDIPLHEYWLVTDSFFRNQNNSRQLPKDLQWEKGSKQTQSGQVDFFYSMLTHLKEQLKDPEPAHFGINGKRVRVLSLRREYDEDIQRVFAVLGDLAHRPQWLQDLKGVKNVSSSINHVDTSHQCILDKSIEIMITSDFFSDDATITLEETDQKKRYTNRFELVKKAEDKTLLTLNVFLKQDFFLTTVFNLFMKKKFTKDMLQSMENLAMFLKTTEAAACHC